RRRSLRRRLVPRCRDVRKLAIGLAMSIHELSETTPTIEIVRHIQAWVVIISFKLFHSEAHQRVVKARQHKRDEKESVTHLHSRGPSQLSFANFPGESKGSRKPDDKSPMRLEFGNQRLEAINEARRNHPNRHEEQD